MDNKKRVVVLLNHYVKIYGSIDFGTILKQLLKEFVDLGQYPPDIKRYDELAEEIHKYLTANNLYARIDDDKKDYRLYLGYWRTPLSMATYDTGNNVKVMVPDSQWFISPVPKFSMKGPKAKKQPHPVVIDDIGQLETPDSQDDFLRIDLNAIWEIDRSGGTNFLSYINNTLTGQRLSGNRALTRQPTDYSTEIVMGFIQDNFFELLPRRKYLLNFGNLNRRSIVNGVEIYREGEGWWITVTDN